MTPTRAGRITVDPDRISVYRGPHILAVDRKGTINPKSDGYYFRQTRFISRFSLSSGGNQPNTAGCAASGYSQFVAYYLFPSPAGADAGPPGGEKSSGGEIVEKGVEIQVVAVVGNGYRKDIRVTNHALLETRFTLELEFDADFADFEDVASGGQYERPSVRRNFNSSARGDGVLTFACDEPHLKHATEIRLTAAGEVEDREGKLCATLTLRPHEPALVSVEVAPVFLGERIEPAFSADGTVVRDTDTEARHRSWLSTSTRFSASSLLAQSAWDRAVADLWSLQTLEGPGAEAFTPMAGIPKYTDLFGRDSLAAGFQSAFLNPSTLRGSLLSVSRWTATSYDDQYDAEPGKILHQRSLDPKALRGETPFQHYYGDYSAPAFFLLGAATYFAWKNDRSAFDEIRENVLATLAWMDRDGDADGDGFYEYETRAGSKGIKNQGWKDSSQAILYPDGSFVRDPIAVAEVQGLYYAAKQSVAGVFSLLGERDRAAQLLEEASALKRRFNERFWMPAENYFALALDPDKRPVKSIASNPGLCLATGIVDDDKAGAVADRLLAPEMFSGWGVRTLSSRHPAYNPLSYHLGSVWPVSNAHICVGLKRYGFFDHLHKVAKALFEAAQLFELDRLPEVFGGHPRDARHPLPGLYPGACSPQAWSATAVIQVCHVMAGVNALAPLGALVIDPALPDWMPEVSISNLAVGERRVSMRIWRTESGVSDFEILDGGDGLRIVRPQRNLVGHDRFQAAVLAATRETQRLSDDVAEGAKARSGNVAPLPLTRS